MKKFINYGIIFLLFVITIVGSCLSVENVAIKAQSGNTSIEVNTGKGTISSGSGNKATQEQLTEINTFIAKAQEAMDMNHLREAVNLYISALVRAEKYNAQEKISEIQDILAKVGAKLTLETGDLWKSTNEKTVTGNSFWAAQAKGIMPAVYLYENFGFGKSPLQDCAIRFEFIENEGAVVPTAVTDIQGFASTVISGIKNPKKSVRIRAYPVFTHEGYSYALKNVYIDFVYVPAPFVVLVYTLEKAGSVIGTYGRNMEKVSQLLRSVPLQPVLMQETVNQDVFFAALQGDVSKIDVPKTVNPDLYALFYIEIKDPYQYSSAYKIFICYGNVTIRVVSKDGTVLRSLVLTDIKGSGSNEAAAIENIRKLIDEALEQQLSSVLEKLYKDIYKQ